MGTYEYKTVKVKQNSQRALAKTLNKEGAKGWEMVDQGKPKWGRTTIEVTLRREKN